MRVLILAIFIAACGEATSPAADQTNTPETTAASQSAAGALAAISPAAQSLTGSLIIEADRLVFPERNITLSTTALDPALALPTIERVLQVVGGSRDIELRRIDSAPAGAALCGSGAPSHVAIVRDGANVTLVLFSGRDPPGPAARSSPCASLVYG